MAISNSLSAVCMHCCWVVVVLNRIPTHLPSSADGLFTGSPFSVRWLTLWIPSPGQPLAPIHLPWDCPLCLRGWQILGHE